MSSAGAISTPGSIGSSEVSVDILADRVRLFLLVLFLIDLGFWALALFMTLMGWNDAEPQAMQSPAYRVLRISITVLVGGSWLFVRRGCSSMRTLRILESAGTVVVAGLFLRLASELPVYGAAFAVLVCSMAVVLRAALVPSSWLRTLAIGLLVSAWTVTMVVFHAQDTPDMIRVFLVVCGVAFIAISVVTSRVIYGLAREVSAARQLGQYELKRKLGAGGMGEVYEATHMLLRRPTAIKLLPVDKIGEKTIARFEREVQQTSRLEHPNSIYIYDYGRSGDGVFYYAMEYLDGLDLQELIGRYGPLRNSRVRHLLLQAAQALAEAHSMGLVHRDIKPANIMVCDRGGVPDVIKVLDFGLVKEVRGADAGVTHADSIIGTPHYLAPEAIKSPETIGPPADVYALGAVGYFLLTGEEVFPGDTVVEVCAMHLNAEPTPPSERAEEVDPELEAVLMRCLAKDPADRPQDGRQLADNLEALDLHHWSVRDARAWWKDFNARLGAERETEHEPAADEPTRMSIDVGRRVE